MSANEDSSNSPNSSALTAMSDYNHVLGRLRSFVLNCYKPLRMVADGVNKSVQSSLSSRLAILNVDNDTKTAVISDVNNIWGQLASELEI